MLLSPRTCAAARVAPDPAKGSRMTPFPRGKDAETICRMNAWGLREGWSAHFRSAPRAGADAMKSRNGLSFAGRRSAPVFHFFRLSRTNPSHGFRNISQGSHADLGITDRFGYLSCSNLGRSPPRSVLTVLAICPRSSNPLAVNAPVTKCDSSVWLAMMTWPPGTRTRRRHFDNLQ